jgi:hypothetical protein
MVLAMALVMVAFGLMISAGVLFRMQAENAAVSADEYAQQARLAAISGINRAMAVLGESPDDPETWRDVPELFGNQRVVDDGANRWYFTLFAPDEADPDESRNGPIDLSSRINVNTASREVLAQLPGMDEPLLDALIDYRDADDEPLPGGAEQTYYDALPRAFLIRNAPMIQTVEELLLIKGFSAPIVYGEDVNFNGVLDAGEDDREETVPPADNGDGVLDRGLMGWLTARSLEHDVDSRGRPRLNLNAPPGTIDVQWRRRRNGQWAIQRVTSSGGELSRLRRAGLARRTIDFILLYRQAGKRFGHPADLLGMTERFKLTPPWDPRERRERQRRDRPLWVMIEMDSGVTRGNLDRVLDRLTYRPVSKGKPLRGLVNVNTARSEVLAALEGMDDRLAGSIVGVRGTLDPEAKKSIAWLVRQDVLPIDVFKRLAPQVTTRCRQFRVRSVGFGRPCGHFRVLDAVVDLAWGSPRVVYLRDVTRLGMPVALDAELEEAGGYGLLE